MNINFHYYVIKTLAHYAKFGRSEDDRQKLAYYSQFVDDYYSGKYPDNMLINADETIPGLSYFQAIGAIKDTKTKNCYIFTPAMTGFSYFGALKEYVRQDSVTPFHFIPPKPFNQLPADADDRTVYRCMAADRKNDLLINMIVDAFIGDIKADRAGGQDEWIVKLGMLLHIYADTFSHEGFSGGWGFENYCNVEKCRRVSDHSDVGTSELWYYGPAIGHTEAMHTPDVLDFEYVAVRKNGDKNEYKEQRNNRERYEICAKNIYMMLCDICGTPPCDDQEWQRIFQKIWDASAEAVQGSNEIYDTEKLNQIWRQTFAEDKIVYQYPGYNPYFGLDRMEIKEIDINALEAAGYSREDVSEVGTVKGNHAREYATTLYQPTDEFFLWNKYAYMHRGEVKEGIAKETAILIGPTEAAASEELKESSSKFRCPDDDQVIVGRYHKGDENGKTQYKYGKVQIVKQLPETVKVDINGIRLSKIFYSEYMKESNSCFLKDNAVIVGREHSGDENGNTRYLYKRVFVETNERLFLPCKTASGEYIKTFSAKESTGEWIEYPVTINENGEKKVVYATMYGREHHGDENGTTTTYFALFDIDQNAKALTEEEFNALQG
ncbi:MAG: hypothetical protein NC548_34280 [Lachnospiraceae bacterium]|nr:hypothetical protein [Acetatifactor muris]MCM1219576.1 hypothetical protein [Lachnospiraceae bacterium]MCM1305563.1 hypothetical protein [Butyrivibrio sp.]